MAVSQWQASSSSSSSISINHQLWAIDWWFTAAESPLTLKWKAAATAVATWGRRSVDWHLIESGRGAFDCTGCQYRLIVFLTFVVPCTFPFFFFFKSGSATPVYLDRILQLFVYLFMYLALRPLHTLNNAVDICCRSLLYGDAWSRYR